MHWAGFVSILRSLSFMAFGVGVFLLSVSHFSKVLQRRLKHKLQPLFSRIGNNRFSAVGVGAGATALMQSSTATTVITVGLVNAGIVTLFQATALIMGANIGTTFTSLLIALSSLQIKYVFMSLFFVGIIIKVILQIKAAKAKKSKNTLNQKIKGNPKLQLAADLFIGFGGIFIGFEILSSAFSASPYFQDLFYELFSTITFPLLLILLGAVFTAIIQSSTASVALYITMLTSGVLGLSSAIFLILGSEIGTCSTTLIASLKQKSAAKSAAAIHLLFNVFSAILFTAILWPFGGYILPIFSRLVPSTSWQLPVFQVIYNTVTVAVLIWFIKPLVYLVGGRQRKREKQKNVITLCTKAQ